ncbi:MAG: AmmeMemoRadiSam system protein A [Candidatus Brocadiaceae bacterium]|nr:AmmeMemoRadiSam system protein A [Candidatus Brocadiaceae bacterium]
MDDRAKKTLLRIARKSIDAAVRQEPIPENTSEHPDLQRKQGLFVTLKTHGKLRGCIGSFVAETPLYQATSEIAIAAATCDSRFEFNHIKPSELGELEIEISLLSPLKPIQNPFDFELGRHGISIKSDDQTGCFLPKVAIEMGWSKEEFLSHCCSSKAGLPMDAWKQKDTQISIFTVETIIDKP